MNIQTVAQNLRNTIAGKEMLLDTYENPMVGRQNASSRMAMNMMIEILKTNIAELKRILQDVEQCVKETA